MKSMSEKIKYIIQSGYYYPEKNQEKIEWLKPEEDCKAYNSFEEAEEICRTDKDGNLYEGEYNFSKIVEIHFSGNPVKAVAGKEWIYIFEDEYYDELIPVKNEYGVFKLYCENEINPDGKIKKTIRYKEVRTKKWLVNNFIQDAALYAFVKASFPAEQQELLDSYFFAGNMIDNSVVAAEVINECNNLIITYGKAVDSGIVNFKQLSKSSSEDKFLTPLFMIYERPEEEYDFIDSVDGSEFTKCPKLFDRNHNSIFVVVVNGLDIPLLKFPLENCDLITVIRSRQLFDYFEKKVQKTDFSFYNYDDPKKNFLCREHKKHSDYVYNVLFLNN